MDSQDRSENLEPVQSRENVKKERENLVHLGYGTPNEKQKHLEMYPQAISEL